MTPQVSYFFVGVGKCGTSWIYEFLRRNDLVATPSIKETYLVDLEPEKRSALIAKVYSPKTGQALADFSNVYYWDMENPAKIASLNPDAKIIITVRKPSDRIQSNFGFLVRNAEVPSDDTLARYLDRGDEHSLVKRCEYRATIQRYANKFGADNVLVLPLELLNYDPQLYSDRLMNFFGLPPVTLGQADREKVLSASKPRLRAVARLAHKSAQWLRSLGMLKLLGALKRSKFIRSVLFKPAPTAKNIEFGRATDAVRALDLDYRQLQIELGYSELLPADPDRPTN